ncbi:hypothetical protein JW960_11580 [candidate division KSB1 bacterium]|nr:hypothetical protein [candidate division KSB1 bacterium]
MSEDQIVQRIYIKGELELISPLVIGSGEDDNSDIDVVRDWQGNPIIPGTSLAGAIRHNIIEHYVNGISVTDKIFGEHGKTSRISQLLFYDATMNGTANVLIRDGVHLDYDTRTVVDKKVDKFSKYDYEILEPGQKFIFRLEAVRRQNVETTQDELNDVVHAILHSLKNSEIAVGAKTRRGLGVVKLVSEQILLLDLTKSEDATKWLRFEWQTMAANKKLEDLKTGTLKPLNNKEHIQVEFNIPYSILIRHYNAEFKDVDSSHIQSMGQSVIPGTSWNGAVRHAVHQILLDLGVNDNRKVKEIEHDIFGYASERDEHSHASKLTVKESLIDGGKGLLKYTRNKVDRFTGGVAEGALFDEMPHYQGSVKLNIFLKLDDSEKDKWKIGLIKLALKDIGNGIQPVGGDANIGRGILEHKSDIFIDNNHLKALALKLKE